MFGMKKTLLLLLAFGMLGAFVLWYFTVQSNISLGTDRHFKVENPEDVYKIFIADRQGETVLLERKPGYWLYNGKYKARPNAIANLLDAITRVDIKYKPPQAAVKNMITDLAANGLKVEIYNKNGKRLKAYYIGGSTSDERGTHMIMEGAQQPYVAYLPGWEGNLRFRYNLRGDDWRDKTIFAYQQSDIQSVTVEYPKQRNQSFRIERKGDDFEVKPFYATTPVINRPLDLSKVEAYLEGFKSLGAEAFENRNPRRDSVQRLIPFSIISVTDKNGNTTVARLFPIIPAHNSAIAPLPGANVVERYFLDWNREDFMLIQHQVFSKVLREYEFFFTTGKPKD